MLVLSKLLLPRLAVNRRKDKVDMELGRSLDRQKVERQSTESHNS